MLERRQRALKYQKLFRIAEYRKVLRTMLTRIMKGFVMYKELLSALLDKMNLAKLVRDPF